MNHQKAIAMYYKEIIEEVYSATKHLENKGNTATYIPELAKINPEKFGVHISTVNKWDFGTGDYNEKFSIQSIAKVLSVSLAYKLMGEALWERVGVEPSGTNFNSLVQLEADKGIPRNPLINAGAIVICDVLYSLLKNPKDDFLAFIRSFSNNPDIHYSEKIAASEKSVGYRNKAISNFLKAYGNIKNNPDDVLDFYFAMCSLELSCKELSQVFLVFANNGCRADDNFKIFTKSQSKRINALMQTCGFYDESGEFAFKVGLPGKSGVGGGIAAVHPGKYAIVVWSPKLNDKGNSYKGMKFLEEFTTKSEQSIF